MHTIKRRRPEAVVIVVTGYDTVKSAVQAMRNGAYDHVTKPLSMEELRLLLERVAVHLRLKTENRVLRETIESRLLRESMYDDAKGVVNIAREKEIKKLADK